MAVVNNLDLLVDDVVDDCEGLDSALLKLDCRHDEMRFLRKVLSEAHAERRRAIGQEFVRLDALLTNAKSKLLARQSR